jgi:hypothetical protein
LDRAPATRPEIPADRIDAISARLKDAHETTSLAINVGKYTLARECERDENRSPLAVRNAIALGADA